MQCRVIKNRAVCRFKGARPPGLGCSPPEVKAQVLCLLGGFGREFSHLPISLLLQGNKPNDLLTENTFESFPELREQTVDVIAGVDTPRHGSPQTEPLTLSGAELLFSQGLERNLDGPDDARPRPLISTLQALMIPVPFSFLCGLDTPHCNSNRPKPHSEQEVITFLPKCKWLSTGDTGHSFSFWGRSPIALATSCSPDDRWR